MDVRTGEIIALVSFPEFDSQLLSDGDTTALASYTTDVREPFLNRAVSGAYAPGSIVKPIFAAGALAEGIISPEKEIESIGYISIPNPYNPPQPTIIRDWRAHGWTDMREAIAVSSDVYFFSIGGGYAGQEGLGILRLDEYAQLFGLGKDTGSPFLGEVTGTVPTPEWKARMFEGDEWRIGDTYNTSIGQYGFQVTPLQMARVSAVFANGGWLLTPHILKTQKVDKEFVAIDEGVLKVVRDGMRLAVTSANGTAQSLAIAGLPIAGKTGTAEVGAGNRLMHSWVIGFWPADNPQYAFATVLERAPAGTLAGAAPAMRSFFEWMINEKAEYVE
jgi:penicillin-binding protein 2